MSTQPFYVRSLPITVGAATALSMMSVGDSLLTPALTNILAQSLPWSMEAIHSLSFGVMAGFSVPVGMYCSHKFLSPAIMSMDVLHAVHQSIHEICRAEGLSEHEISMHLKALRKTIWKESKSFTSLSDVAEKSYALSAFLRATEITIPYSGHCSFIGKTSRSMRTLMTEGIEELPEDVMKFLYNENLSFTFSSVARSIHYDLKDSPFRSATDTDARTHLDDLGGAYYPDTRNIMITEFYRPSDAPKDSSMNFDASSIVKGYWIYKSYVKETIRHEVAHGIDFILGSYNKQPSSSKGFVRAYTIDVQNMGGSEQAVEKGYPYFVRDGTHMGYIETFAELWAQNNGGSIFGERMANDFPITYAWVDRFSSTLKHAVRGNMSGLNKLIFDLDYI